MGTGAQPATKASKYSQRQNKFQLRILPPTITARFLLPAKTSVCDRYYPPICFLDLVLCRLGLAAELIVEFSLLDHCEVLVLCKRTILV